MSEPVGIIYPPAGKVKDTIERTAFYVGNHANDFEEKLKEKQKSNQLFSFLFPGDPFHAYYVHKVKERRDELLAETLESKDSSSKQQEPSHDRQVPESIQTISHTQEESNETRQDHHHHHSDNDSEQRTAQEAYDSDRGEHQGEHSDDEGGPRVRIKLNEYLQEKAIKLEQPPSLNYLATPAPSLTRLDCDIMRLTSQFIATYGRTFLLELVSREQSNSQFDFLKPQHGQFSYMTNLIMQYALILNEPLDYLARLDDDSTSQKQVLDRIKMRAEWTKMLELEEKKQQEAEEKEKLLYSQIDWHDFVVVETIDYQQDERGEYPPTTADQVGTRLLIQQRIEDHNVPEEMEIDMDVDSDQEEEDNGSFAVPEILPPKPDKVVIRRDYNPKAAAATQISQLDNYFVSPITNELITVDKIHEHVRYNLADPRHLEKKDQMLQDRMNEEVVFASGSQIQDSLKSLAERRTDIFGTNEAETAIGRRIGEEEQVQSKDDRLIWDGHKSSLKKKKLG